VSDAYDRVAQYIVDDTGRPDKAVADATGSSIIERRIRRAVLGMHRIDFWKKDFRDQIYIFDQTGQIQVIDATFLPRLRAFGYIRKWDGNLQDQYQNNVTGAPKGSSLDEINPEKMLDGYGYDKQDVFYRAGDDIKLNLSAPVDRVLIGWFQDPFLDPIKASDSWILANYPDLISAIVKRRIFRDIGKDDESKASDQEYSEELLKLQTNNITLKVM
jgi:hypothetical protein